MFDPKRLRVPEWAEKRRIIRNKTAVQVLQQLKPDFCLSDENIEAIIARVDKLRSRGKLKGRAIPPLLLTSAYLFTRYRRAHRRPYNPARFAEICCEREFWVDKKELNRYAKLFRAEGLYPPDPKPSTLLDMYWPYVKDELDLSEDMKEAVEKIVKKCKSTGNPEVIIAGAMYMAGLVLQGWYVRQADLSKAFGISEVSIRNFMRKFKKHFSLETML